jgi:hypothetical protein
MSDYVQRPAAHTVASALVRRRLASASRFHRPVTPRLSVRASLLGALAALLGCAVLSAAAAPAFASSHAFISGLKPTEIGSTVPGNGDVNPYGIVTVPRSAGKLVRGDILISNFNNEGNEQGRGTTLVQLTPGGTKTLFAQISQEIACPGGVGLTTALAILPNGYVVVGSLPTTNGEAETAQAGCLIVLNPAGEVVKTISGGPINGPWDMTEVAFGDDATLFVTNVLNGTVENGETPTPKGTVVRIRLEADPGATPVVTSEREIATGFPERTDPTALVVGPTGVGLGLGGTLFVADTQGNRIAAIPNALFRQTVLGGGGLTVASGEKLMGPLGLTIAPNGDILTANAGDGNIVETTPFGAQLAAVDTGAEAGGLFGLTIAPNQRGVYFVNDTTNELGLLR